MGHEAHGFCYAGNQRSHLLRLRRRCWRRNDLLPGVRQRGNHARLPSRRRTGARRIGGACSAGLLARGVSRSRGDSGAVVRARPRAPRTLTASEEGRRLQVGFIPGQEEDLPYTLPTHMRPAANTSSAARPRAPHPAGDLGSRTHVRRPRSVRVARCAEPRAAGGRHLPGRPAADPGRGRHRQDDDAVRPRGLAARARACPPSGSCC